jgi:hypothetical protein
MEDGSEVSIPTGEGPPFFTPTWSPRLACTVVDGKEETAVLAPEPVFHRPALAARRVQVEEPFLDRTQVPLP